MNLWLECIIRGRSKVKDYFKNFSIFLFWITVQRFFSGLCGVLQVQRTGPTSFLYTIRSPVCMQTLCRIIPAAACPPANLCGFWRRKPPQAFRQAIGPVPKPTEAAVQPGPCFPEKAVLHSGEQPEYPRFSQCVPSRATAAGC